LRSTIRITVFYLVFAGLWILFSDRLLGPLTNDAREITLLRTYKGILFVFTSGLLLFVTVLRSFRSREKAEQGRRAVDREMRVQLEDSRNLQEAAHAFSRRLDFDDLSREIVERCVENLGTQAAILCHRSPGGRMRLVASCPASSPFKEWMCADCGKAGESPISVCRRTLGTRSCVINDVKTATDPMGWKASAVREGIRSLAFFPLHSHEETSGALMVAASEPGFFSAERTGFFQSYAHQAAIALESACLFTEKTTRLERLKALRIIDGAIASSFDLKSVLRVVLDQVVAQLEVDCADVLLLDRTNELLQFVQGRGFRHCEIEASLIPLSEELPGRAARERTLVVQSVADLQPTSDFARMVAREGFQTYIAAPLVAKEEVQGVLEVFHRSPLDPEAEWLDFFQTMAGQAAIAIENAVLSSHLESTNEALTHAYDRTLEGWSHALELRDIETHGHTQRVSEATVLLARVVGMSEDELIIVRRGALLHDIGKLAIPDRILLKAGPLDDDEWDIMSLHPLYAYELLAPIPFLRPALDIPFSHHEWWDGTGYPRGLRGEEIPLAARVFAVIDVVDALCSNRPYCEAWPRGQVLDYVRTQAGRQFDPQVVDLFLEHLDEIFPILENRSRITQSGVARQEWRYYIEVEESPENSAANPQTSWNPVEEERTPVPVSGARTPPPLTGWAGRNLPKPNHS